MRSPKLSAEGDRLIDLVVCPEPGVEAVVTDHDSFYTRNQPCKKAE
jgi:hypothetical protein